LSKIYTTRVVENRQIIKGHFLITLENPLKDTRPVEPGNFFMLSPSDTYDPLLRRPLSVHRINHSEIQFLYRIAGRGTLKLSEKRNGDPVSVLGPLGNSFPIMDMENVLFIAGGIGIAPIIPLMEKFLSLNKWDGNAILFYGVRTERDILLIDSLRQRTIELIISTDDGSFGERGDIVSVFKKYIRNFPPASSIAYACGPVSMLKNLASLVADHKIPCYVAMEGHMACGTGICMGCAIMTVNGYKRICREGPVFACEEITWARI